MKKTLQSALRRLIILLLIVSILLSSLVSCDLFSYVAESKDEIIQNIEQSDSDKPKEFVYQHLRQWGMPIFDKIKFQFVETVFQQLYNYENGLPDTKDHAKDTAELFLSYYYDKLDVSNKTEVTDALISCYVAIIGDPYSIYRPPVESEDFVTDMSGKFGGIGVIVEFNTVDETIMISTVYPDSPAEKAGVKVGDYIYAVDGHTVNEVGYTNMINYVRGEIGTSVELILIRSGERVTVNPVRAEVEEINVSYEIDSEKSIGYVQIISFKDNTYKQFVNAIDALEKAGVKGIVFDLRGNPGGYLRSVIDVISYIVPTGNTVVTYQYKGRKEVELKTEDDGIGKDHVISLPMTIICDEYTASAGEIFVSALRDYRKDNIINAKIIGVNTFGKGIMQDTYQYPGDGSTVTLTVSYYNPPCGVNYHNDGISPDITVENTESEDLQLITAYEELIKLINAK